MTSTKGTDFSPLARVYQALEWLAFGGDLERARFALLDRLAGRSSILVLGEGDGRCLARLLAIAPGARIDCVDVSPGMIARTAERIAHLPGRENVNLLCADALAREFPPGAYDAVVTLFFLDCFTPDQAAGLVERIAGALRPGACWLFADFRLPSAGPARWRARLWLGGLYAFFRWRTGLSARALPPSEALIEQAGFRRVEERQFQWGLLGAILFAAG
ncbi:MAG: class I SAM-dependent methyltransferase [Verrucomicrobia bacterium]|nr:class I SAM-dependent methyltransferase [Verrucomicrobiota bacterium]